MKHAGAAALDQLESVMEKLRLRPELKEKKRGLFYRNGKSFLHFHEDPAGLFADVFTGAEDLRLRVSTHAERKAFLAKVNDVLGKAANHANR